MRSSQVIPAFRSAGILISVGNNSWNREDCCHHFSLQKQVPSLTTLIQLPPRTYHNDHAFHFAFGSSSFWSNCSSFSPSVVSHCMEILKKTSQIVKMPQKWIWKLVSKSNACCSNWKGHCLGTMVRRLFLLSLPEGVLGSPDILPRPQNLETIWKDSRERELSPRPWNLLSTCLLISQAPRAPDPSFRTTSAPRTLMVVWKQGLKLEIEFHKISSFWGFVHVFALRMFREPNWDVRFPVGFLTEVLLLMHRQLSMRQRHGWQFNWIRIPSWWIFEKNT